MISSTLLLLAVAAYGVNASPMPRPQGVTALISPSAAVPSGCELTYDGLFAIAAVKAEGVPIPTAFAKLKARGVVTQLSDAQPGVGSSTVEVISQISDAQPQAPSTTSTMMHTAISQIHDGQVQVFYTVPVVTQISDAQIQAPTATTVAVVSQISDAQPQATLTTSVVSQASDAQPQVSTTSVVSQASDAQPQESTTGSATGTSSAATPSVSMVACKTNSTLELDLKAGRLLDGKGRIGYIASNYQFQFDAGVPQAGAIYTSGFSVCSNGTLALGGSAVFWQCLSGDFYNLYDRYWAAQCSPVFLRVVGLKDC